MLVMNSIWIALFVTGAVAAQNCEQDKKAVAVLLKDGTGPVIGNVSFVQTSSGIVISGLLTGLDPGQHGFHIHEKGDLSNGCVSLGPHFNPFKKLHAAPTDANRHVGDLGNIGADGSGVAKFTINDSQISLTDTRRNILGRGVIVHKLGDDLGRGGNEESTKTGNAGARFACGVVGIVDPANDWFASSGGKTHIWNFSLVVVVLISLFFC